jgi:hypothetical protein
LCRGGAAGHAGIEDEQLGFGEALRVGGDLLGVAEIAGQHVDAAVARQPGSEFGAGELEPALVASDEQDVGSFVEEPGGDRAADATRAAGHDGEAILHRGILSRGYERSERGAVSRRRCCEGLASTVQVAIWTGRASAELSLCDCHAYVMEPGTGQYAL